MQKIISLYKKYEEIVNYLIVGVLTTVVSLVVKWGLLFTILNAKNAFQLQTYEWHTSPIKSVTMPRCFENQNDIFDKVHNIKFTFLD